MIDDSLRNAPVIHKGDYPYLIHPLTDGVPRCPPALLREWMDWATAQQDILEGATVLLAPEAMALPLATAISLATEIPALVVRKRSYGLPGESVVHAETGYAGSVLHLNDIRPDDRVVVIDDVLSTGGTLESILFALQEFCEVQGTLVFIDKGDAAARIEEQYGPPVRVMRRVHVTDQVKVL